MKNIKTIYFGDSIMAFDKKPYKCANEYNYSTPNEICRGYPTLLNERLGLIDVGNFAVGGHKAKEQLEIVLKTDFKEADLFIMAVGVNDFGGGTPIGSIDDKKEDNTFFGALNAILRHVFNSNPNIKVILMTPLHRNTLHRKEEFIRLASDSVYKGQTLYDFVSAIKAVGKKYNVTVCDMFNESGLTMQNAKDYTFEGVHPHNKGYEFIINPLIKAVKTTFNI